MKQEKWQKKSLQGVSWHQTDRARSRRPGNGPETEGPSLQAGWWALTVDGHTLLLRMLHVLHQLLRQLLQLLHLFQLAFRQLFPLAEGRKEHGQGAAEHVLNE